MTSSSWAPVLQMCLRLFNWPVLVQCAKIMAQGLCEQGFELVSTGGSAAALEKASLPVQRVEQLTGFPEMLDGEIVLPLLLQCQ